MELEINVLSANIKPLLAGWLMAIVAKIIATNSIHDDVCTLRIRSLRGHLDSGFAIL